MKTIPAASPEVDQKKATLMEETRTSSYGTRKIVLLIGIIVVLLFGFRFLPINEYLTRVLEWTRDLGAWGPIVLGAVYIPACVLMLPGSIISLGAGLLFGVVTGTVAVSVGSTLGACAAFLVGRTIARDWVSQKVEGNARFAAVSRAVAREGFKIVFLTRLSPVFPFNLLNYAYGLTTVPFWKYAVASWIGMLPGTVLYVYIGSTLSSLADLGAGSVQGGAAQTAMKWIGLAVTVLVTMLITRIARKAMKDISSTSES